MAHPIPEPHLLAATAAPLIISLAGVAIYIAYHLSGRQPYLGSILIAIALTVTAMIIQTFVRPSTLLGNPTIFNMLYMASMGMGAIGVMQRHNARINLPFFLVIFATLSLQVWYFDAINPQPHTRIAIVNFAGATFFLIAAITTHPMVRTTLQGRLEFWCLLLVGLHLLPRGAGSVAVSFSTEFEHLFRSPGWLALQFSTATIVAFSLLIFVWSALSDIATEQNKDNASTQADT